MSTIEGIEPPEWAMAAIGSAVKTAIDEAARLGLTWRLRPGTVGGNGFVSPHNVPVTVDGDAEQVRARSMVNGLLRTGDRVWCIQVPPAGIYVLGVIGNGTQQLTQRGSVSITPNMTQIPDVPNNIFSANYYRGSAAVLFPIPFSSTPTIMLTPSGIPPGQFLTSTYQGASATGFQANVARTAQTALTINWIAVGNVST